MISIVTGAEANLHHRTCPEQRKSQHRQITGTVQVAQGIPTLARPQELAADSRKPTSVVSSSDTLDW